MNDFKSLSQEAINGITKEVNKYAKEKGYKDGNQLEEEIRRQLNDPNLGVKEAGANAAIDTIKTLSPKIFTQIVDNFGTRDIMTEHMEMFYWGVYDEGNIAEIYSNLTPTPNSTGKLDTTTPFFPRGYTEGYNQSWKLNYVDPNNPTNLAPEAYAFKQDIVYQQTSLLTQFRTGAGLKFLVEMNLQLYESLKYLQYHKWANTMFTLPSDNMVNGRNLKHTSQSTNSFEAWVEVSEIITKMISLNNKYNYNGSFKRMHALRYEDMILYMSRKTLNTLKRNLKSQLYNNGDFEEIINKCTIITPEYKLQWTNISGNQITVGTSNVANGASIDPIMNIQNIPSGLTWTTKDVEWIPDNQIFIATKKSCIWMKQSHLEAGQFFANNFSETKNVYELGLMSLVPDAKYLVFECANLNTDINSTN